MYYRCYFRFEESHRIYWNVLDRELIVRLKLRMIQGKLEISQCDRGKMFIQFEYVSKDKEFIRF